jgi:iron(III) transport system substrate-binding protein
MLLRPTLTIIAIATTALAVACSDSDSDDTLTIYSGRSESLVAPLFEQFTEDTGVEVEVRYGDTAELAATILEEGDNSPADVFFSQDGGALGALAEEDLLATIPQDSLDQVPEQFRSPDGLWVGISGRSRVVAYSADLDESELPDSILDFTDPEWSGRIGWAPTNGSFQAFVTGLRELEGEDAASAWLEGIKANNPTDYEGNAAAVEGIANGEVDVAFVNHYYLYQLIADQGEDFPVRNHYTGAGDPGSLINVAGAAILDSSGDKDLAEQFIEYLLATEAQEYFAQETYEYPLVEGIAIDERLTPLDELNPPDIDLSNLSDLQGTLDLLRETGVLP